MAGWIKMPLSTEVGLCPGDIVLDGDPAAFPQKGAQPPSQFFGPCLLWRNGGPSQLLLSACWGWFTITTNTAWHAGYMWFLCSKYYQLPIKCLLITVVNLQSFCGTVLVLFYRFINSNAVYCMQTTHNGAMPAYFRFLTIMAFHVFLQEQVTSLIYAQHRLHMPFVKLLLPLLSVSFRPLSIYLVFPADNKEIVRNCWHLVLQCFDTVGWATGRASCL